MTYGIPRVITREWQWPDEASSREIASEVLRSDERLAHNHPPIDS